ncbi:hypothetical protein FN846DRAFT_886265 [Sphaerosporella brunnea]|uniref:Uncharacterized protein n=1 Tax=Sphaerosporella brunnea TaxID=1250544 RepID=A0A5J5FAZ6_9PEZI|nr:hypothetical protein FN846DRAFT_886265 [Sphaerosporella brunnea]
MPPPISPADAAPTHLTAFVSCQRPASPIVRGDVVPFKELLEVREWALITLDHPRAPDEERPTPSIMPNLVTSWHRRFNMPRRKKKDVSPVDAAAARLTASLDRLQGPSAVAREVVAFDELMDMRTWVLEQLSEPRQEGEAEPKLVTVPSIAPLWLTEVTQDMHDGQHAVWDRQDNTHQDNPPETPKEHEGEGETPTMYGDDEERIALVADAQENDVSIEPGVGID